ncbi:MAG: hypothetical protein L0196_05845 [candidate division Zixibacteria bacterium]|nr:hypothetical protein [candidate division Zixibacteria bacterium]
MSVNKPAAIAAGVVLFLLGASSAFSQPPDPRDSIILESKTVAPGAHPGALNDTASYLYVKVFITNKDSLSFMVLPVEVTSTSGGAYAIVACPCPRSFFGVVNPLTSTLRYFEVVSFTNYDNISPDKFAVAAGNDGIDPTTIEPPNATRKAVWELKFDTVRTATGTFELDSSRLGGAQLVFTTIAGQDVKVNFLKSVITVAPAPKGDLNLDFALTGADIVLLLNCTFCDTCPPPLPGMAACDLNCDGVRSAADIVLEIYAVFLFRPFPCNA